MAQIDLEEEKKWLLATLISHCSQLGFGRLQLEALAARFLSLMVQWDLFNSRTELKSKQMFDFVHLSVAHILSDCVAMIY